MEKLTFGGYPLKVIFLEGTTIIKCKGVSGTLNQIELFLNGKPHEVFYFGESKMVRLRLGEVEIDCLKDTMDNINEVYTKLKKQENAFKIK